MAACLASPQEKNPCKRGVRVFVSSTFSDVQEKREILVKKTFLELRRRRRERLIDFVEVDLR